MSGSEAMRLRVASGFDVHPFVEGRSLIVGGVLIPCEFGLDGHSDGDVAAHAITDAVLGGARMGDIGEMFPSGDTSLKGADSMILLKKAWARVKAAGFEIVNVDLVLIAQKPRLSPWRKAIENSISAALEIPAERVSARSTTTDGLGFIGRVEVMAAQATCLILTPRMRD